MRFNEWFKSFTFKIPSTHLYVQKDFKTEYRPICVDSVFSDQTRRFF